MRFLATGDVHCHNWSQFSYIRKDGMNSRLYNCLQVFRILKKEAEKRGIDKILINGDLLEENAYIDVEVYNGVYAGLEKLHMAGLEVVLNVGNHDILRQTDRGIIHTLRPLGRLARVIETPTLVWKHLQVVPWINDPNEFKRVIGKVDADGGKMALALHVGISGAKTGPKDHLLRSPLKLRDVRGSDFSAVILSDYHTRQHLAKNVFYLGSPLQHSFGEIHRPCIWEITLEGRSYSAKKIYTKLPEFLRVPLRDSGDVRDFKQQSERLAGNYVRVDLGHSVEISDGEIERYAKSSGFLVQIDRTSGKSDGGEETSVRTLAPEEAIWRYVASNSKSKDEKRLRRLGEKIYKDG